MAEPLAADPARLIAAGSKLAELVFPVATSADSSNWRGSGFGCN